MYTTVLRFVHSFFSAVSYKMGCCPSNPPVPDKEDYKGFPPPKHFGECIICLESDEAFVDVLPCAHMFHYACLHAWRKKRNVCPICQMDLSLSKNIWSS